MKQHCICLYQDFFLGTITDLPGNGPTMPPVVLGPFTADYYGIKSAGVQIVKW